MNVHHYHIQKTGGKSICKSFLTYCLNNKLPYTLAPEQRPEGWKGGEYFFSSSHLAVHQLGTPSSFYRFVVFRDPVARLKSFYNYVVYAKRRPRSSKNYSQIKYWPSATFGEFLENLPKHYLLAELFMFSKTYSIKEALSYVRTLNRVLFLEQLQAGLDLIASDLKVQLPKVTKEGARPYITSCKQEETWKAINLLKPSYLLLEEIREITER